VSLITGTHSDVCLWYSPAPRVRRELYSTRRFGARCDDDRHCEPRCRQCRTGTGVPALGRALRAPVQASAGLRPGTPCPSAGLRPALRAPNAGQCRPSGLRPALRGPCP